MGTEDAAVRVHLVDDHIAQAFEKLRPLGVVRQDALMQHVGVADDDIAAGTHRFARVTRRVAIEGEGAHAEIRAAVELDELGHLILRQRLGRKQVESLGLFLEYALQHRQVVAQGFARRGGRDHYRMPAGTKMIPGRALVGVEPWDTAAVEGGGQARIEIRGHLGVAGRLRGHHQARADTFAEIPVETRNQAFDAWPRVLGRA